MLLDDPQWHPAAIPLAAKRCITMYRSRRARRLYRRYLARLATRTNNHDKHSGDPITVMPVYGDDSEADVLSEDTAEESEEDTPTRLRQPDGQPEVLRLLTWNVNGPGRERSDAKFIAHQAAGADILCLQEVTPGMLQDLNTLLGDHFEIVMPETRCGRAWPVELHDVALVLRKDRFSIRACIARQLDSDQQRCFLVARLVCLQSGHRISVATTHLESRVLNAPSGSQDLRALQLQHISTVLQRESSDAVILAGDLNLREWEALQAKIGDDGGEHWHDAWSAAGARADLAATFRDKRYDRILLRRRQPLQDHATSTAELVPESFVLIEEGESDHRGVCCQVTIRRAKEQSDSAADAAVLAKQLRAGVRPRLGCKGVARRPKGHEHCAKMEPNTAHDPGGPKHFCGKGFEKPRVPVGDAALVEDDRRKDLWRLHLPRNGPHLNGYIPTIMVALGANMDAQTVTTAKGAADYVAKYISKYGPGQKRGGQDRLHTGRYRHEAARKTDDDCDAAHGQGVCGDVGARRTLLPRGLAPHLGPGARHLLPNLHPSTAGSEQGTARPHAAQDADTGGRRGDQGGQALPS